MQLTVRGGQPTEQAEKTMETAKPTTTGKYKTVKAAKTGAKIGKTSMRQEQ